LYKYQLSLTSPRDALHHDERAANKQVGRSSGVTEGGRGGQLPPPRAQQARGRKTASPKIFRLTTTAVLQKSNASINKCDRNARKVYGNE